MAYHFSKIEQIIFKHTVKETGIKKQAIIEKYTYYLRTGKQPSPTAPQWQYDLWREAQERKRIHREEG